MMLCLLVLIVTPGLLRADEHAVLGAVRAIDDVRTEAMIAGDRSTLAAILSDQLRYGHASGAVDTKESQIAALESGQIRYTSIRYEKRDFRQVAPGVVMVSGHGWFGVTNRMGPRDLHLTFLGVWRIEDGRWRFLAWQSSRLNPPETGSRS